MKGALFPILVLLIFNGCARHIVKKRFERFESKVMAQSPGVQVFQPELMDRVKKVAVLDFRIINVIEGTYLLELFEGSPVRGKVYAPSQGAGTLMAESLEEALLKSGQYEVSVHSRLESALNESGIQLSTLAGRNNNGILQKENSVDVVILGTIANAVLFYPDDPLLPFFEEYGIRLRLLDVKTGKIIASVKDKTVFAGVMNSPDYKDTETIFHIMANRLSRALVSATGRSGVNLKKFEKSALQKSADFADSVRVKENLKPPEIPEKETN